MYKALLWFCLAGSTLPAMATTEVEDSQYRAWCTRSAVSEMIPADERENHILECIASLVEADKNPKSSARKRKGGDEDEG